MSDEAKKLATTSWIWGVMPTNGKKVRNVKLYGEQNDIIDNVKLKTTCLKPLTEK